MVTLPKNAKIETATYTDPDGAGLRNRTPASIFSMITSSEQPGFPLHVAVSDSSSVSSDSSEETDSTDIPTPEETKKISFLSTLLYILLGPERCRFSDSDHCRDQQREKETETQKQTPQ